MEFCLVVPGKDEQRFGCFNICGQELSIGIIDLSRIRDGILHKSAAREMKGGKNSLKMLFFSVVHLITATMSVKWFYLL